MTDAMRHTPREAPDTEPSEVLEPVSAGSPEAKRLLEEVRALLGDLRMSTGRPVRIDSDLARELGLDSLSTVELLDRVERAFQVRLPEEVLATAATAVNEGHRGSERSKDRRASVRARADRGGRAHGARRRR